MTDRQFDAEGEGQYRAVRSGVALILLVDRPNRVTFDECKEI